MPGQLEAFGYIGSVLDAWRQADTFGPFWPATLSLEQYRGDEPPSGRPRPGWCYGTSGVARALQLAGLAAGEPAWLTTAYEAGMGCIRALDHGLLPEEAQLCHGLAGTLHCLGRIEATAGGGALAAGLERIAAHVLGLRDLGTPFGFVTGEASPNGRCDPGWLQGAAGVLSALHAYASGRMPESGWDAALLLS
ncbi:lanthionine synthetase LanC family protein [Nonomuraea candida]|uniref:lanthionine synthetase LanC family protein n=1 Tax=Nonomuraea candida TaxID=359159 RepID=UPI000693A4D4